MKGTNLALKIIERVPAWHLGTSVLQTEGVSILVWQPLALSFPTDCHNQLWAQLAGLLESRFSTPLFKSFHS